MRLQVPPFPAFGLALLLALGSFGPHAAQAQAKDPAAIIEAIDSATVTDLEVMDFLYEGMELPLGEEGTLTLSYLRSCRVEQITGGTVRVGERRSEVTSRMPVEVIEVDCGGGGVVPTDRQREDAAGVAFRSFSKPSQIPVLVYSIAPLFVFSRPVGTFSIERMDPGARKTFGFLVDGRRLDLAEQQLFLEPGGLYRASSYDKSVLFRIVPSARGVGTTIVERLIGF